MKEQAIFSLSGGCSLLRFGRKGAEIKLPAYGGSDKISALSLFFLRSADAALPMFVRKHLAPGGYRKFL